MPGKIKVKRVYGYKSSALSDFFSSDTLYREMESRFPEEDVGRQELLLLVPSSLTNSRWREKREEYYQRVKKVAELYKEDMGSYATQLDTQLHLWVDHWYVNSSLR